MDCAVETIWISPPHTHSSFELLFKAGCPPTSTVGEPGIHGAIVIGMQGIGVSAPSAAAVAAMTCGLPVQLHVPNGMTLTIGM